MIDSISAVSELVGEISLLLGVAFLWRYGPLMGAALRRFSDLLIVVSITRHQQRFPHVLQLLDNSDPHRLQGPPRCHSASNKKRGYEVSYFARKHGIPREEARKLIERVGNDRDKLNRAAERLKKVAGR